jgi:hypothetical protein
MLLALDYDDTYTRDPEFWDSVITLAKQHGHSVICATMRYPHDGAEVETALGSKVEKIIYTGRKAKHGAVYAAGYMPSVWIDDSPHWIHMDAQP